MEDWEKHFLELLEGVKKQVEIGEKRRLEESGEEPGEEEIESQLKKIKKKKSDRC